MAGTLDRVPGIAGCGRLQARRRSARRRAVAAAAALLLGAALGAWTRESGRAPDADAFAATRATVVELGSTSCASCRAMQDVLREIEARHPALAVRSVDVLKDRAALAHWNVQIIPTQVFLDAKGREVERHVGFISAHDVVAVFARHGIRIPGGASP